MKVNPIPEGFHTVTPYLAVHRVGETVKFLKAAFEAVTTNVHALPNGQIMNCEIRVGDSMLMMGEKPADQTPAPAMLYMYVEDADKVFQQAVKAGAKIIAQPTDQFYGDRSGAVEDPSGNQWWIASRKENLTPNEINERAAKFKK